MFGGGEKELRNNSVGKAERVNGLLDKGCSFEGKLTFDGTVQINGNFEGEIYSDGTLVVGNDANVKGKIFVDTLILHGKLEGQVEAKSRIEMHVPAVVVASVQTKSLSVEDGVVFEGECHMEQSGFKEGRFLPVTGDGGDRDEAEEDVLVM